MSSRPLNKNPAIQRKVVPKKSEEPIIQVVEEYVTPTISQPEVPIIDVQKAQEVQKDEVEEVMSMKESIQELLPVIGVGVVLLILGLSLFSHYYNVIFST